MQSRRKTTAIVTAVTLVVAILLTGTFAWRSISQQAKNEIIRVVNPGGRLHDDFNGENKDVYVENFFTTNEGGQPIFARVRLDEYMEIGTGSGLNLDTPRSEVPDAPGPHPVVSGTEINDLTTWKPFILNGDSTTSEIRNYWELKMGLGSEVPYLPTFNKNKDSLKADINGTYAGLDGDVTTSNDAFSDYKTYTVGEEIPGDTYLDADTDSDDEGDSGIEGQDYYVIRNDTHTVKMTGKTEKVMTMTQWKAAGYPIGPYWVFDNTDDGGWFYWAQPINPGEATGLLLDEIKYIYEGDSEDSESYYAINVVGQFATAGDWGEKPNETEGKEGTGFFDPTNNSKAPTNDALNLLNLISGDKTKCTVTVSEKNGTSLNDVDPSTNPTFAFQAEVTYKFDGTTPEAVTTPVTWTLSGNTSANTTLNTDGELTIGTDEAAKKLTVKATAGNKVAGTIVVNMKEAPTTP